MNEVIITGIFTVLGVLLGFLLSKSSRNWYQQCERL